ncbi:DUF4333 domain-containing protein [Pseudonocardia sp. C8]|uniref:DUF4333 domain-containing protein n=1 Tax=Pseudonocardia sp. C8 TaxID=2762759 RepID=UPI0016429BD7|nr:DUF4333 domain-containing protein [Pseudonocardia sp. C8]MBC3192049.1 DUF4333 domain-containing protein [Pseudonocardia sp. C8]
MSNPQGPDRQTADDADATERTGELPAVGGQGADPGATGGSTGASTGGSVWGDENGADPWAIPTGRGARPGPPGEDTDALPHQAPASPWAGDRPTTAQPSDGSWGGGWSGVEQGEEPWAPQEDAAKPSGIKKWGLVGGGALLAVILAVTAFLWPAWAVSRHLDQTALQTGVHQVLTRDYGLQVGAVQCPDDVTVAAGTTFSCQAVVDGEQVEVPGVVTSDEGDYQIKRV